MNEVDLLVTKEENIYFSKWITLLLNRQEDSSSFLEWEQGSPQQQNNVTRRFSDIVKSML